VYISGVLFAVSGQQLLPDGQPPAVTFACCYYRRGSKQTDDMAAMLVAVLSRLSAGFFSVMVKLFGSHFRVRYECV
jgi:hypothetical protein